MLFPVRSFCRTTLLKGSNYAHKAPFLWGAVRCFAGRVGGKKRRKSKRIPGYQQLGVGRLLEFVRYKKLQPRQIYMYQNVRTHLVCDAYRRRWLVMWYSNGLQQFRIFSYHRRPLEVAKRKALVFYQQLLEAGVLKNKPKLEATSSGVSGVYYDRQEQLWVAVWQDAGIRRFRGFSASVMGFHNAYRAAVLTRRQKLLEHRQFVMQVFRKRRGSRRFQ